MINLVKNKNSFTLVEILVVLGILAIISTTGFVELSQFKGKQNFDLDAQSIVEAIGSAQNKAIQQEGGTAWGIRFDNSTSSYSYQVFQGSSYSAAAVVSSETLSSATAYSNPPPGFYIDVVFAARTGLPTSGSATSIVIKRTGGSGLYTIMVNSGGRISKNLETGLVGYWPLNEGSGGTAYDASGNNNTGTVTIGASGTQTTVAQAWANATPSRVGVGLNFDGTDDFVQAPLATTQTDNWTIMAWANSNTTSGAGGVVQIGGPGCGGYSITRSGSNWYPLYSCVSWNPIIAPVVTGAWIYIAVVRENGVMRAYANGVQTVSGVVTVPSNPSGYFTTIGKTESSYFFGGKIDDVRIYNRALSATEVQNLYNSY